MRTQKRRRRECKTDYKLRLGLLKSPKQRIVIRRTNKYLIVQAVESVEAQDTVVKGVSSKDLIAQGWDEKFVGSLKSIPAAYLTGKLLAKELKTKEGIVDIGMAKSISGNRIFAVVKGLVDGGLKINADPEAFPSEDRINGKHMSEDIQKIITKINAKIK
ncbi:50S ribosomal protein L18 [archaeon]|nr:50S ribosomal protein L18 [archaeon]